ncbi:uncharacterized protein LOC110854965 isoform X3 [Folsomia candida]|uniref:uncharacterized protein LOC110854965 isoform X3 n=1 Tax=Folsomia candida TaxID=158441 RepID=UPI000B90002D|nr:uncharacterized protein LOC110854965 isoform X3 [Folsomia candida]
MDIVVPERPKVLPRRLLSLPGNSNELYFPIPKPRNLYQTLEMNSPPVPKPRNSIMISSPRPAVKRKQPNFDQEVQEDEKGQLKNYKPNLQSWIDVNSSIHPGVAKATCWTHHNSPRR